MNDLPQIPQSCLTGSDIAVSYEFSRRAMRKPASNSGGRSGAWSFWAPASLPSPLAPSAPAATPRGRLCFACARSRGWNRPRM